MMLLMISIGLKLRAWSSKVLCFTGRIKLDLVTLVRKNNMNHSHIEDVIACHIDRAWERALHRLSKIPVH